MLAFQIEPSESLEASKPIFPVEIWPVGYTDTGVVVELGLV